MHTGRTLTTTATALAALLAVAGCNKRTDATADSASVATATATGGTAAATQSTPGSTTAAPNANADSGIVVVHATNYSFTAPKQLPAGMTTFRLTNDGPGLHHMALIRLDSAKTMADLNAWLAKPGPEPKWVAWVGAPNATDPGTTATATVDLQPGNYAILCFVDIPEGMPHFAKGMVSPLTVTAATGAARPAPVADDTLTLQDYGFVPGHALTAGHHVIEVRDAAAQTHEVQLVRLAPGKTMNDMMGWFKTPKGPPPGSAIGGVSPIRATPAYLTADLTPGNYVLICFVPDAKDGKPHFMHGMVRQLTIS